MGEQLAKEITELMGVNLSAVQYKPENLQKTLLHRLFGKITRKIKGCKN